MKQKSKFKSYKELQKGLSQLSLWFKKAIFDFFVLVEMDGLNHQNDLVSFHDWQSDLSYLTNLTTKEHCFLGYMAVVLHWSGVLKLQLFLLETSVKNKLDLVL